MHRYDRIMRDIDRGLTDEELAMKYREPLKEGQTERQGLKAAIKVMHVYRMVHDGTLPPPRNMDDESMGIDALLDAIRKGV